MPPTIDPNSVASNRALPWSPWLRGLVSLAIVYHLAAVIIAPMSIPPSIHGDYFRPWLAPYMAVTFLDHGYKFFAPDPGPSHLVRYELEFDDGHRDEGVFPSRDTHWPRLYYHRHFMLSEFINTFQPGPDFNPNLEWEKQPLSPAERTFAQSYAAHLLAKTGAARVRLYLRRHLLPSPMDVLDGKRLDDPSFYRERMLGTFDPNNVRPAEEVI